MRWNPIRQVTAVMLVFLPVQSGGVKSVSREVDSAIVRKDNNRRLPPHRLSDEDGRQWRRPVPPQSRRVTVRNSPVKSQYQHELFM